MSEFAHSIVLFSGDDGLPLEFNIQNVENGTVKAMIEHGGGRCTLSDDAIFLVSPGTKVLNVAPKKKILSSRYIFDCVKENVLLEMDEYRIEINEMEASDFSDISEYLIEGDNKTKVDRKCTTDTSSDILEISRESLSPNLIYADSNHDFDFEESEKQNNLTATCKENGPNYENLEILLPPSKLQGKDIASKEGIPEVCEVYVNIIPESLNDHDNGQNVLEEEIVKRKSSNIVENNELPDIIPDGSASPVQVTSSQPIEGSNLNKETESQNKEDLSQSNTVSSSGDAVTQGSPKVPFQDISAEIFTGNSLIPDSPSEKNEKEQYIKDLEKKIEDILQKPSPKTLQDKIMFVKYISCVKKLAPAHVLQTLHNIQNI